MNIPKEPSFDKRPDTPEKTIWQKLFLSTVIILIASLSFGTGLLVAGKSEKEGVRVEFDPSLSSLTSSSPEANTANASAALKGLEEGIVASKNSDKYHYSHCPGAKQISEDNRITFQSPEDAEASGYSLAGNCKKR